MRSGVPKSEAEWKEGEGNVEGIYNSGLGTNEVGVVSRQGCGMDALD